MNQIVPPWQGESAGPLTAPTPNQDTGPVVKRRSGFQPGISGNPLGKRPGTLNHKTRMRQRFEEQGEAIAEVVLEKAMEGDLSAAALVLQRLCPPLRPAAQTVTFELNRDATLLEQAGSILAAVAQGALDPESGRTLIGCLSTISDLRVSELMERLAVIEKQLGMRGVL